MADFEDEAEQQALSDEEASESASSAGSQGQDGKRRQSKGGASAASSKGGKSVKKAHAKPKKGKAAKDNACYIAGCEKKVRKQKSCAEHKKIVDAILYQAEKQGKKAEVEQVLADPVQASKSVQEFEANNPPGRFRKKLIDFTQWLKTYSTETAQTNRDSDELYSFQDFSDEKTAAGWDASAILKKWQSYERDPAIDHEDDGSLWLPKRKQRIRDQTRRISSSLIESSKNMKGCKQQDVDALKQFTITPAAAQTNSFFREAAGKRKSPPRLEEDDLPVEIQDNKKKKGKRVDLANASPTVSDKELGQLQRVKEQMNVALGDSCDHQAIESSWADFPSDMPNEGIVWGGMAIA